MKDWLIALAQAVGFVALILWAATAMTYRAYSQQRCSVNEFYGLAWTLHNPSERHQQMLRWLTYSGPSCAPEDLVIIWNNLAEWGGTADSAQMRQKVISLYEKAVAKK